jgi:hypothetical protein
MIMMPTISRWRKRRRRIRTRDLFICNLWFLKSHLILLKLLDNWKTTLVINNSETCLQRRCKGLNFFSVAGRFLFHTHIWSLDPPDCKRHVSITHKFCFTYISLYKLVQGICEFLVSEEHRGGSIQAYLCVCVCDREWERAGKEGYLICLAIQYCFWCTYEVCLKSSVNCIRKQTKQEIQTN